MLFLFLSGMVFLYYGAEYLIDNGKKLAIYLEISPIIIGLTIVAFGTSLPEMIVSLLANLKGEGGIALGNIIGSNIANIGLVLGVSALLSPISLQFSKARTDFLFLVFISFLLVAICYLGEITKIHGFIFVLLLAGYLRSLFNRGKVNNGNTEFTDKIPMVICLTILGIFLLYSGTELFIRGSIGIAEIFGVTNTTIGLTLIALGTSAPELAASISAARKGESDMIIGNIIGSNLFNILAVIGFTSIFKNINIKFNELQYSIYIFIGLSCLLPIILLINNKINRFTGFVFCFTYGIFLYLAYY